MRNRNTLAHNLYGQTLVPGKVPVHDRAPTHVRGKVSSLFMCLASHAALTGASAGEPSRPIFATSARMGEAPAATQEVLEPPPVASLLVAASTVRVRFLPEKAERTQSKMRYTDPNEEVSLLIARFHCSLFEKREQLYLLGNRFVSLSTTLFILLTSLLHLSPSYSTVTDFAKLRGWSASLPIATAVW